ncbi:MAG: exopolyphosphatase [Cyclobacteriaceae bacterium]|nr:exopolyphosphatase [Cyclobacteriaceae bacterium]
MTSTRLAVIDLGTNTFHLLIAEKKGEKITILHREKQPVKIGVGGINRNTITAEAADRAVKCLTQFQQTIKAWNVTAVQAIGTSALRNANNRHEVIRKIQDAMGIEVKLISGSQEAELIYRGVRSAVDLGNPPALIVDIGGGSVEFIIGNAETIFWKESFEVGGQRLLEQFQKHDPILKEEVAALHAYLLSSLQPLNRSMEQFRPTVLVGSSGTFDTLSEIYCHRNNLPFSEEQPETPLTIDAFHEIHQEFLRKNRAERMAIAGMIELRVDMIVVACCLIDWLLASYPLLNQIRVSSFALKEGVLSEMIKE